MNCHPETVLYTGTSRQLFGGKKSVPPPIREELAIPDQGIHKWIENNHPQPYRSMVDRKN